MSKLTITKLCVECRRPAVTVPLVTGGAVALWCNDHLAVACEASIVHLGRDIHNFIFSVMEHDIWFWEVDISHALQASIDALFEEIARDLYNVTESIFGLEDLIRVKAKELRGTIKFSQQDNATILKILPIWLSPGYIVDIKGPLGKETSDIIGILGKGPMSPATAQTLTCMTLSAKRAASYEGRDNCAILTKVEQNIWTSHKLTLGGLNV